MPGNPDIKLWNGMVGDWMEIDPNLIPQVLVKQTLEHWLEMCRCEECIQRLDWEYQLPKEEIERLTKNYSRFHHWEINPYIILEDVQKKRYKSKSVMIMQAKTKGVKTFDRCGDISY